MRRFARVSAIAFLLSACGGNTVGDASGSRQERGSGGTAGTDVADSAPPPVNTEAMADSGRDAATGGIQGFDPIPIKEAGCEQPRSCVAGSLTFPDAGPTCRADVVLELECSEVFIDPGRINVQHHEEDGRVTTLFYDDICDPEFESWRYSDPDDPRAIELCPAACDIARFNGLEYVWTWCPRGAITCPPNSECV